MGDPLAERGSACPTGRPTDHPIDQLTRVAVLGQKLDRRVVERHELGGQPDRIDSAGGCQLTEHRDLQRKEPLDVI